MITVESSMDFDFLLFLAKYSFNENSQAVAPKKFLSGDLLPVRVWP